jgi:hypothetical protein
VFEDVGQWKRAWYYPRAGEDMHQAVNRECRTVREVAGMFDASTLGKIEVVGPDAAEFLNLMYTNPWDKLEPGRCKYGIMLREDGFIYDDGVVGRMAEDRFPRDHDDRRRTAGHASHGRLSADRVPASQGLADLDDRTMGGHRRAGAEGARDHCAAGRGHRSVELRPCRI